MNTNGDIMMPMMQLGSSMMNVFDNHETIMMMMMMMKMFKVTMRTDMIRSSMMLTMAMVSNIVKMKTVLKISMFKQTLANLGQKQKCSGKFGNV